RRRPPAVHAVAVQSGAEGSGSGQLRWHGADRIECRRGGNRLPARDRPTAGAGALGAHSRIHPPGMPSVPPPPTTSDTEPTLILWRWRRARPSSSLNTPGRPAQPPGAAVCSTWDPALDSPWPDQVGGAMHPESEFLSSVPLFAGLS